MATQIEWDTLFIRIEIDRLEELRRAIQEWSELVEGKLNKTVEEYEAEHGEIPEGIWDGLGDRAFSDAETQRIMYAGLASAVASCAENIVGGLCEREEVPIVNKEGKPIGRPNWGHKKGALEQHLKIDFADLEGFRLNKLSRLLSNCFKHNDGLVDAQLAKCPGFTKGEPVGYESQNWPEIIDGSREFLVALAKKMPPPKDDPPDSADWPLAK